MIKNLLLIGSITVALSAQDVSDFKKEQMKSFSKEATDFKSYRQSVESEFESYQKEQLKAYNAYKKELSSFWKDPKTSTKKTWVAYTEDKKTRSDVDFEKETIVVETIAASEKEAKQKLKIALAKVVTIDTKSVQETDPLEIKLSKIKKPPSVVTSEVKAEPILSTVIFETVPTKTRILNYVNKQVSTIQIKSVKSYKVPHSNIYSLRVKMPKNSMVKRSKIYYKEVKKQAARQNLPIPLVFAIMHSESNFNPRARSHVPAYGLMQIVPKSAGIDTYKYLYKKKRLVSGAYLYDSKNNITMGSGYLHILYYKYLRKIKNPDSIYFVLSLHTIQEQEI